MQNTVLHSGLGLGFLHKDPTSLLPSNQMFRLAFKSLQRLIV